MTNRRRILKLALAAALLGSAAPASAWQYDTSTGSPGDVVSAPPISFSDVVYNPYQGPVLLVSGNGPTVNRSPATRRAQDVNVIHVVQKFDGTQWYNLRTYASNVRIPAGYQRGRTGNLTVYPNAGTGAVRVAIAFNTFRAGTNRRLGFTSITPSSVGDNQCATNRCTGYWDGVVLGRMGLRSTRTQVTPPADAPEPDLAALFGNRGNARLR